MLLREKVIVNSPLSYDYHGNLPLNTSFHEVKPSEIDLYLDLDTHTGKNTCGQNCRHCWFVNYEKVNSKSFGSQEGKAIFDSLQKQGFNVYPRYTDSFAYDGELMKIYGTSRNRSFKEQDKIIDTETMKKGEAWTSGRPLLSDNYEDQLDMAAKYNYGTIAITFHGLLDDKLDIQHEYPIKGVFHGLDTIKVIDRIQLYNSTHLDQKFRIAIGITIGKHNYYKQMLLKYVYFFNKLGIDSLRFNNFYDHGNNYPELVLSQEDVKDIYDNFAFLHKNVELGFQLGVSQDFGTSNIEALNYPKHVENCKAGLQLFAIIPNNQVRSDPNGTAIGTLVGCVNTFDPELGTLYRIANSDEIDYRINFNYDSIKKLQQKRIEGIFKNGCFSKELSTEIKNNIY